MKNTFLVLRTLALFSVGTFACAREEPVATPSNDGVVKVAFDALDARVAAVHDYEYDGVVKDSSGRTAKFHFAFSQPTFTSVEVEGSHAFVFDGVVLVGFDHKEKKTQIQKMDAFPEETRLLVLHQTFSAFSGEGFRPPLLRKQGLQARVERDAQGDLWVLRSVIEDAQVAALEVRLRSPDGAFVSKTFVDKQGKASSQTAVTSTMKDPATGLSFPLGWKTTMGNDAVEVALSGVRINQGIAKERFSTTPPSGYSPLAPEVKDAKQP